MRSCDKGGGRRSGVDDVHDDRRVGGGGGGGWPCGSTSQGKGRARLSRYGHAMLVGRVKVQLAGGGSMDVEVDASESEGRREPQEDGRSVHAGRGS